jgi:hypothetical protein
LGLIKEKQIVKYTTVDDTRSEEAPLAMHNISACHAFGEPSQIQHGQFT